MRSLFTVLTLRSGLVIFFFYSRIIEENGKTCLCPIHCQLATIFCCARCVHVVSSLQIINNNIFFSLKNHCSYRWISIIVLSSLLLLFRWNNKNFSTAEKIKKKSVVTFFQNKISLSLLLCNNLACVRRVHTPFANKCII